MTWARVEEGGGYPIGEQWFHVGEAPHNPHEGSTTPCPLQPPPPHRPGRVWVSPIAPLLQLNFHRCGCWWELWGNLWMENRSGLFWCPHHHGYHRSHMSKRPHRSRFTVHGSKNGGSPGGGVDKAGVGDGGRGTLSEGRFPGDHRYPVS